MAVDHPSFDVTCGDDEPLAIPVTRAGGVPVDLSGATASFAYALTKGGSPVNRSALSAVPTIGTVTVRGVPVSAVLVPLLAPETDELVPFAVYFWSCRVVLAGSPKVVARGAFRVIPNPD